MPAEVSEPAIGASHHASRVTTARADVFEAIGDDFRMLDKARQIVDDAGSDDLIVGEREFLQYAIFMLMPGVGEGQHEPADIGLLEERQDVGERDVAIVRPLVISPRRGVALGRVAR